MLQPITAITNLIISLSAFIYAGLLWWQWRREKFLEGACWVVFMLTLGLAAFVGMISYSIELEHEQVFSFLIRCFLGITGTSLVIGSAITCFGRERLKWIVWVAGLYGLTYYLFLIPQWGRVYTIVDIYTVLTFLFFLGCFIWILAIKGQRKAKWMIAGMAGIISASCFRVTFTKLFLPLTHDDIYHIIIIISLYFLYRGMKPISLGGACQGEAHPTKVRCVR